MCAQEKMKRVIWALISFMLALSTGITIGTADDHRSEHAHIRSEESAALYRSPSNKAEIVGRYNNGTYVSITGIDGEWAKVSINSLRCGPSVYGYVQADQLYYGNDINYATPIARVIQGEDEVTELLDGPNGSVIGYCVPSMSVVVIGETDDGWCHVRFYGTNGFLMKDEIIETGLYTNNYCNELPVIGYGVYDYTKTAWGQDMFIDCDGFLNTTLFPYIVGDILSQRTYTFVTGSTVSIQGVLPNATQLEYGFGPKEYLHVFLFDEILHSDINIYNEGVYQVGTDIEEGLYSFEITEQREGTLSIANGETSSPIQYNLVGPATYTVYLPGGASVTVKGDCRLSTIASRQFFVPDDASILGSMRLLAGHQIKLNPENTYSIMPLPGFSDGYYRICSFLVDTGIQLQGEMKRIAEGEIDNLYIDEGQFLEFINCKVIKNISNG